MKFSKQNLINMAALTATDNYLSEDKKLEKVNALMKTSSFASVSAIFPEVNKLKGWDEQLGEVTDFDAFETSALDHLDEMQRVIVAEMRDVLIMEKKQGEDFEPARIYREEVIEANESIGNSTVNAQLTIEVSNMEQGHINALKDSLDRGYHLDGASFDIEIGDSVDGKRQISVFFDHDNHTNLFLGLNTMLMDFKPKFSDPIAHTPSLVGYRSLDDYKNVKIRGKEAEPAL